MALMNYGTLLIELTVPFMLFIRPLRVWAMGAAFLMHTGIDLFMSIRFFSLAMYVGYLSFLDTRDWNWWVTRVRGIGAALGQRGPSGRDSLTSPPPKPGDPEPV